MTRDNPKFSSVEPFSELEIERIFSLWYGKSLDTAEIAKRMGVAELVVYNHLADTFRRRDDWKYLAVGDSGAD